MGVRRFYVKKESLQIGNLITFDGDESNHIRNTLRLSKGDTIVVFNGQEEYVAELISLRSGEVTATLIEFIKEIDDSSESEITVFLSLIKPKQFELAIEKLTELGIDDIIPLETKYCVVKSDTVLKRKDRWQKIILAACKQSERISVPKLHDPLRLSDISSHISDFDKVFSFSTHRDNLSEKLDISEGNKKIAYVIGPEGGFTEDEEALLESLEIEFKSLGENILRSETAAIVALSRIKYEAIHLK